MLKLLRNLLLLEILAATVFVGIMAAILLNRVSYYQEAAEKANMELTISSLRSALRMRMAAMMIEGRAAQFPSLAQDNPMDWVEQIPANYSGVSSPDRGPNSLAGKWVFDTATRSLIYWVERGEHFRPDSAGERKVRLQIVLIKETPSAENAQPSLVTGARLVLLEPYKWF
jgi:type II secretory pathway pseudopilin PulG